MKGDLTQEIADELGLSVKQIEDWITRYNKREALLLAGKERKVRGRPRKDGKPLQERIETELKRLQDTGVVLLINNFIIMEAILLY